MNDRVKVFSVQFGPEWQKYNSRTMVRVGLSLRLLSTISGYWHHTPAALGEVIVTVAFKNDDGSWGFKWCNVRRSDKLGRYVRKARNYGREVPYNVIDKIL